MNYEIVKKLLSKKSIIVITTHKTPDGDALGSSLALFHALKNHHDVHVIVPNEYPHYLNWLPSSNEVLIYEDKKDYSDPLIEKAELIFCLDYNKLYRTYNMSDALAKSSAYKIMIDHHEDPDLFCNQILSDSSICSTAELVYDFLFRIQSPLTRDIAICLYTGIITDSGSLRYPNVTYKTHLKVSKLMEYDINHTNIHKSLFDSQNKSRFELLKICLNNLQLFENETVALTYLMEEDLMNNNYKKGDTEGFVNFPLSIKNVYFSTFFIQFEDGIKMSFRSQGDFDVNIFANNYFNGGGHKNAAGGFLKHRDMTEAIKYFKSVLTKYLK